MKKLFVMLLLALFAMSLVATHSEARTFKVAPTYFWPGEDGGRRNCDGNRLQQGDAAVDFRHISKGQSYTLTGSSGSVDLVASDCGGSDVIDRKAAHARGSSCLVVDIWVPSERVAREREAELGGSIVTCEINDNAPDVKPQKIAVFKKNPSSARGALKLDFYAMTTSPARTPSEMGSPWSSKRPVDLATRRRNSKSALSFS